MSLPAFPHHLDGGDGLSELTRSNNERQFKPFIYLNARGAGPAYLLPTGKVLSFRQDFSSSLVLWFRTELPVALPVLIGFLTLTAGILLLLARFAAATLLLAGLVAWLLVLLARVLVLAGHRRLLVWTEVGENAVSRGWFPWNFRFPTN
jgi:hypothetical protein